MLLTNLKKRPKQEDIICARIKLKEHIGKLTELQMLLEKEEAEIRYYMERERKLVQGV